MKKLLILAFLAFASFTASFAQTNLGLGLGLSTPNDQVNSVYNSNNMPWKDGKYAEFLRESAKLGYHLAARLGFPLGDNARFIAGAAWHRFPQTEIEVINPDTKELLAKLATVQNIFPLSGGVELALLRKGLGVYVAGEVAYNYFVNSVDIIKGDASIPLEQSKEYSRVGISVGGGIDFDLKLFTLDIGARYNHLNLIGKESGEPDKSYISLTAMVIFGAKSPQR